MLRRIARDYPFNEVLITDIRDTLQYLQGHVDEAKNDLVQLNQEDIFLNVDNPASEWEWVPASILIFNAPDGSGFRAVRSFLKPYEDLILGAGGSKVARVRAAALLPSEPEVVLATFRTSFDSLRQSGTLIDVVFVDASGGEHRAHRAFLVSSGPYFRSMFSESGMSECRSASSVDPVRVKMPDLFSSKPIRYTLGKTKTCY